MTEKKCDYYKCKENAVWLAGEGNPAWNLCQGHLDEMDSIVTAKPFDAKKLLGWWTRGKSPEEKDNMAKEMAQGAAAIVDAFKNLQKGEK